MSTKKSTQQKIPQHIISKMHRLAKIAAEAKILDKEINEWFEKQGYNTQISMTPYGLPSLRDDTGMSLSKLSDGNDITNEFIISFEKGDMEPCKKRNTKASKITDLALSNATKTALNNARIKYVRDLDRKTSDNIKLITCINEKRCKEIYDLLNPMGYIIGTSKYFIINIY